MTIEINEAVAAKVLATVDAGLCRGVGEPEPGKMCVEAVICFVLGLPHGDDPPVSRALRSFKIKFNDAAGWSSDRVRAKGLRRLALIQLGSAGFLDDIEFAKRLAELAIRKMVPLALRASASIQKDDKHKKALCAAATRCEKKATRASAATAATAGCDRSRGDTGTAACATCAADAAACAAYAAYAAAYAADAAYAAACAAYAANAAAYAASDAVEKER